MNSMLNQIRAAWGKLGVTQKIMVGGLSALLFLALVAGIVVGGRTDYRVLSADLDPVRARQVVAKLDEAGIPNRVSADTAMVEVASGRLDEARRLLLKEGLVASTAAGGYESLKEIGIGDSRRMVDERVRMAKEGEVAATLESSVDAVSSAKVLITPARESFYRDGTKPAKAAVAVETHPGMVLEPDQLQGIRALVANAWQDLTAGDVTVTVNGRLVSLPDAAEDGGSGLRLAAQARETALQNKVESALAEAFGAENIRVRVTMELDPESEITTVTDLNAEERVATSEKILETENSRRRPGGVTGVQGALQERAAAGGDGTDSSTLEQETRYKVPGSVRRMQREAGDIRRIAVGILVDESLAEQEGEIAEIAKAMVGYKEGRDVFSLKAVPFNRPEAPPPPPEPGILETPQVWEWVHWGFAVLVAAAMAVGLTLSARKARRSLDDAMGDEEAEAEEAARAEQMPPDPKKQIIDVIGQNPEAVSRILRNWLYEPVSH